MSLVMRIRMITPPPRQCPQIHRHLYHHRGHLDILARSKVSNPPLYLSAGIIVRGSSRAFQNASSTYRLCAAHPSLYISSRWTTAVTFTTVDPLNLPVPSRAYFELHTTCCRVAHPSGAVNILIRGAIPGWYFCRGTSTWRSCHLSIVSESKYPTVSMVKDHVVPRSG